MVKFFLSLTACFIGVSTAYAGNLDCTGCHAVRESGDIRPLDGTYRNISTSAFQGNHQLHMTPSVMPTNCSICHNNGTYKSDHLDGKIQLAQKIGNYSTTTGRARYNTTRPSTASNGLVFFNQTSVPVLSTCSNVNCHFETITPTWGGTVVDCTICHGAPPLGLPPAFSGGAAGSHARHASYYSGTANCIKCHSDHNSEANKFSHATSAGKRTLSVLLRDPQNNSSGTYSYSSVTDYQPSQASEHNFGTCNSLYCHSPGTKSVEVLPPNATASWGGSLGCDGCHQSVPTSGSHPAHVTTEYGVPVPCFKCHSATVNAINTISSTTNHVNMKVDIAFDSSNTAIQGKYSGNLTPMQKNPGTGYGRCENVYCHSSGQGNEGTWPPKFSSPKWGYSSTGKCGTCHKNGLHDSGPILNSGSHEKHLSYDFGTTNREEVCGICHYGTGIIKPDGSCSQCHFSPNAALTTKHINHQVDVDFVSKFGGTYNGTPEPGDGYSNCSNIYCHSNGTSVSTAVTTSNMTQSWGTSGSLSCSGCHEYPPAYQNGAPKANSHTAHSSYGCQTCHAATTTDGTTIASFIKHVNKIYDLQAGPGVSFIYTFAASGGACSNISCHGNNSATWGSVDLTCGSCHSTSPGD